MIKPTVMTDSLANAILSTLGCAVHVLQQGEDGGHMDDWGEHVFPAFKIYKAVSVGGDRRTVIADLQAQMQADKGDAVSVWYRHESGSEAAIESATTGPEVFMELAVAFSREANDVAASKTSIKPGDYDQSFGQVLEALHSGYRAAREGWNGKGMFIFLVPGSEFEANRAPLMGIFEKGTPMHYRPHLDMFTADGQVVTWTISQSDALARDWLILPREHSTAAPQAETVELDIPERP